MRAAAAHGASSGDPSTLFSDVMPLLLILLGVVLVGGVIIYVARRAVSARASSEPAFTLQDLRDLHRAGKLSDEEFERAKDAMIGRLKAGSAPDETGNQSDPSD